MLPLHATNVLLCLRYGIGDVVMELPVISALRTALPAARITALGSAPAHELLEDDPRVDRVVSTERWGLAHRWDPGSPETVAAITEWVRRQEFHLVLDAGQAVDAVSSAIWSLGIRSLESPEAVERQTILEGGSGMDAIREAARVGWGLGGPPDSEPSLHPRAEDHARAAEMLEMLGVSGRPVAFSPVASLGLKRWPLERFATLADLVLERCDGPVLILEGPDRDIGRAMVRAMTRPERAIRIGPQHLLRTAALLTRCRALVCNDTGLMHVSAAMKTPTIGVFGPTQPRVFLPRLPNVVACAPEAPCPHRAVASLRPPACWNEDRCLTGDQSCIREVPPERVLMALQRLGALTADPGRDGDAAWDGLAARQDPAFT